MNNLNKGMKSRHKKRAERRGGDLNNGKKINEEEREGEGERRQKGGDWMRKGEMDLFNDEISETLNTKARGEINFNELRFEVVR